MRSTRGKACTGVAIVFCWSFVAADARDISAAEPQATKNVSSLYLELKFTSISQGVVDGDPIKIEVFYQIPHRWHIETDYAKPLVGVDVYVCDGETAWSYKLHQGQIKYVEKWEMKKLVAGVGEERAMHLLLNPPLGVIGCAIGDRNVSPWKKELAAFSEYDKRLERKGEEKLNGTTVICYEEKPGWESRIWFGKQDHIFRKQVLWVKPGQRGFIMEAQKVDTKSEIPDKT